MGKRLLYFSVHEILEYDELKLFSELGYECYSLGAYTQPGGEEHRKRPPLELPYNPHFIELALQYDKRRIHPEMLEDIDIVVIMHEPSFLGHSPAGGNHDWSEALGEGNWPLFREFIKKGGRVIWRSIGQSVPHIERKLQPFVNEGLEIVRYSPAEATIKDNAGCHAMIRFYKDPEEYAGWNGSRTQLVNFTQSLKQRADHTGYAAITQIMGDLPAKIYGPGNEGLGAASGGLVTYEQQRQILREARAFIYHGTYPASYTLSFIEAMMTGVPMICVGRQYGDGPMFKEQRVYEIPDIISNGRNGYISDNLEKLHAYAKNLLASHGQARAISAFGRARAIELFGKSKIKAEWASFLGGERK